jgi:signal transduction histidine kinase
MRSLLGVLRDPAGRDGDRAAGPELAPQPGIDELSELLGQARAAGLPVSLTVSGVPRPVPEGEALAVYRVVQESLTNVRKHAGPGVTATVSLGYAEEGLVIRVTDDGRGAVISDSGLTDSGVTDGGGHGLAGMRERIELYGGSVRTGSRPGGGYEVVARLPLALEPA